MTNQTIYTRVYSQSSAARLVSAKASRGEPLSEGDLLNEFRNHADIHNRKKTVLVSASTRIVDTIKRAYDKYYMNNEPAEDIWIAFIEVLRTRDTMTTRIHSAKDLANKCMPERANLFSHEVVFEYAIPKEYVTHQVNLQTLLQRGLEKDGFFYETTSVMRSHVAEKMYNAEPWDIGVMLGCFARTFGARSPLWWLSHQLFHDCVWSRVVQDDVVSFYYAHGLTAIVHSEFFCDLEHGTQTALFDWWLADDDFLACYADYLEQKTIAEDAWISDLTSPWEGGNRPCQYGTVRAPSTGQGYSYKTEMERLSIDYEKHLAIIEAYAVKIGL